MTPAAALIERMSEQRRTLCEVEPGVSLRVLRPPETEMPRLRAGLTVDLLCEYVDGWAGVTEAVLLGADQAAPVEVAFDVEVLRHAMRDRGDWATKVADAIRKSIADYLEAREVTAKN